MIHLSANQRYAFTFGDALLRLYERDGSPFPLLFRSSDDASEAAVICGLRVNRDGTVVPRA